MRLNNVEPGGSPEYLLFLVVMICSNKNFKKIEKMKNIIIMNDNICPSGSGVRCNIYETRLIKIPRNDII